MVLWIRIEVSDFSILHVLILKFRQYSNVNIVNFVHYGKTPLRNWFVLILRISKLYPVHRRCCTIRDFTIFEQNLDEFI